MELLGMLEIDEKATIKNTRKFFEKDLERYEAMCAGRYDVHGLACLKPAIDNCTNEPTKPYKRVLELRYLKHMQAWQIAENIGYSHTQYGTILNRAFLQFADIYLMEQLKQGVNDILDLHEYKKVA